MPIGFAARKGSRFQGSHSRAGYIVSKDPVGQWFVDSALGDDSDTGRNHRRPMRTVAAAAQRANSADRVRLCRGRTWREELTGYSRGITLESYGDDEPRPKIDGRDIAQNAAFSKTDGFTNVYQISWTHNFNEGGGTNKHRAWEDGTMMTRAASQAACDATAGTFWADTPSSGGPDLIYVHPSGSTDPTSDGKEYSFSARRYCVELVTYELGASVYSLETIGNAYSGGSLRIDGYAEDCILRDGRVHCGNVLGEAVNCHAIGMDPTEDNTGWITYVDIDSPGAATPRNHIFRDCSADAGAEIALGSGFYAHTDGVYNLGTVQYEDCRVVGFNHGYSGIQADTFLYYRCSHEGTSVAYLAAAITRTVILGGTGKTRSGPTGRLLSYETGASFELICHGAKVARTSNNYAAYINLPGATVKIERCSFFGSGGAQTFWLQRGDVTWRRNVAYGAGNGVRIGQVAGQVDGLDADLNCYWDTFTHTGQFGTWFGGIQSFADLAEWQTYLAGIALGPETSSIEADPQLADPANGDFTIGNATVLALGAGAEVDEEDDAELQAYWEQYRVA